MSHLNEYEKELQESWDKLPNDPKSKAAWMIQRDGEKYAMHIFMDYLLNRTAGDLSRLYQEDSVKYEITVRFLPGHPTDFDTVLKLCKSRVQNLNSRLKFEDGRILLHCWPPTMDLKSPTGLVRHWDENMARELHSRISKSDICKEISRVTGKIPVFGLYPKYACGDKFMMTTVALVDPAPLDAPEKKSLKVEVF